jgi:hypothetical protein
MPPPELTPLQAVLVGQMGDLTDDSNVPFHSFLARRCPCMYTQFPLWGEVCFRFGCVVLPTAVGLLQGDYWSSLTPRMRRRQAY